MRNALSSALNSFALTICIAAFAPLLSLVIARPVTPVLVLVLESAALLLVGLRCQFRFRALHGSARREQANLGAIADGMADLRRRVDEICGVLEGERQNIGQIADAVYRLRLQISAGANTDDISDRLDKLDERVAEQSKNLGLVAGGLDNLRHAGAGVDLVQGRYAALSDSLIDIAAHVDVLSRTVLARETVLPPGLQPDS